MLRTDFARICSPLIQRQTRIIAARALGGTVAFANSHNEGRDFYRFLGEESDRSGLEDRDDATMAPEPTLRRGLNPESRPW
jgi:hypothetical protein